MLGVCLKIHRWRRILIFISEFNLVCCNGHACHFEEIPFVFGTPLGLCCVSKDSQEVNDQACILFAAMAFEFRPDELVLQSTMMSYWGNFAWTGNPNGGSQAGSKHCAVFHAHRALIDYLFC